MKICRKFWFRLWGAYLLISTGLLAREAQAEVPSELVQRLQEVNRAFTEGWEHPGKWIAAWILILGIGGLIATFFMGRQERKAAREQRERAKRSLDRMQSYEPVVVDLEKEERELLKEKPMKKGIFFDHQ